MNEQAVSDESYLTENETQSHNGPSLHTRYIFASAWIIISVAGVLGNSLVIYVAVRFQKMTNVTNCFIVNLAVTDIVFLAFCMPLLVAQYTLEHWSFNETTCKLMNFISFVSVLVTVLTLVAMTIDRYIYVVRPFQNLRWRKPRYILLLSIIIWLTSCLFASPFYFFYGVPDADNNYRECVLRSNDDFQQYFRIYTVTIYYFIPLTIIIMSYARLLYYVYSKENKLKPKTKHNVVKWSKKRRAVTKMVAIVTLAFSLCWLPITLYIMSASIFKEKTRILYYFKVIANSCAYLNSAINPILYAFLNRSFRNNCGSLFTRPSCGFICVDQYHPSPDQQAETREEQGKEQQKYTSVPLSTQQDRFSYQSTNRRSSSPKYKNKKQRKKSSTSSYPNQLTSGVTSHNEFSDADYDLSEAECGNQVSLELNPSTNLLHPQASQSALTDKMTDSNTEITTF
ncbi:unnamed protein product [Adineta ricciae]|uniref:G-protein coupled receptors family 1 profile domain-containing protein n=1 Tax=Adineta ricciae TaxID=249248 RepID=A0A815GCJ9_ADIRI|nr:unnamed protein product [Adineta ricciae]